MTAWPKNPNIYEINTWVWLYDLSRKYGRNLNLGNVPGEEWDSIAASGVDAVWFMGVWERSPKGRSVAVSLKHLTDEFKRLLPDFSEKDVASSPYCVHRYRVDQHLGGPDGLAHARKELAKRDIRLILDFVPNHVALDHPWVKEHPEYFVCGGPADIEAHPDSFVKIDGRVFARARDPNFPPWQDLLQLNAIHPGLRRAVCETLLEIACQCDGVRCDMAMLVTNEVFSQVWGYRASEHPNSDYWPEAIATVEETYPEFTFIAEVYWGFEFMLMQQGFDFCYDKVLYDCLIDGNVARIKDLLRAHRFYQDRLIRFIENHDERRAAAAFAGARARAAAVIAATLPGGALFHEGQFEGRRIKVPIQLTRRPNEPKQEGLEVFYRKLLQSIHGSGVKSGEWHLCERYGWQDNASYLNILAWCWRYREERYLVVVNYASNQAQARVRVPWDELKSKSWLLKDVFAGVSYERYGGEMCTVGLYVDLPPWGVHFFKFD